MNKIIILGFSALIIIVSFLIGWNARRKITDDSAFVGGAKIFGPFSIGLSTMAAVGSAFAVVGIPGIVYFRGNTMMLFMLASVGFTFGYIMIGKKIRAIAELGHVASLGDITDLRFNKHRGIKIFLSLATTVGCIAYLASQIAACTDLFVILLDINKWLAGGMIFGILIIYTMMSGEVGGVLTQAFQGFIMVIAGLIIVISFFIMLKGFSPVIEAVSHVKQFGPNHLNAWGNLPGPVAFAWILLPTIGIMCQPQVLTRMLSLKDPMDLPRLSLFATATNMILGFMVMTIAYSALYLVSTGVIPPFTKPDHATFEVANYLGLVAQVFVYAAVLAAAMSTSSLFLSLLGGIVSRDLSSAAGFKLSAKSQKMVYQVSIGVVGVFAIWFALTSGDMVAILGTFGFGALMAATLPVVILGLLWKKATSQGVFFESATAFVLSIAFLVLKTQGMWKLHIPWYMPIVAFALLGTVIVSLFTKGATGEELDPRVEKVIDL